MTVRTDPPLLTSTALTSTAVPVQLKLAAAWAAVMLLYSYVDYLTLYVPGFVNDLAQGVLIEILVTEPFVVTGLALMAVPILMIPLSTMLPPAVNRIVNLVVASIYIPVSIANLLGASWWVYYGLGVVLEVAVLAAILRMAWTWRTR